MMVLPPLSTISSSNTSTFSNSPISSPLTTVAPGTIPAPTANTASPHHDAISMALNCINGGGDVKQENLLSRSLQGQTHVTMSSSLMSHDHTSSTTVSSHPSMSPNHSPLPMQRVVNEDTIFASNLPSTNQQLLEMAAAEAGIVGSMISQEPTSGSMASVTKSEPHLEQQLHEDINDFLPMTTQHQSIRDMVATYAPGDMAQSNVLIATQHYSNQYMDPEMYYYPEDTSVGHASTMSSASYSNAQMNLTTIGSQSEMGPAVMDNAGSYRRGQYQTPPPLPPVNLMNIPPESLQSPDSGYGDTCSTPKETGGIYQEQFFFHSQTNSYIPNGVMFPTIDTAQISPVSSIPSPVKQQQSALNTSMSSSGFQSPSPPPEKTETKPSIPAIRLVTPHIQIDKIHDPFGFHYTLDAPTSTAQRVDEDRITYVNKGQFYPLTVNYLPYENPSDNLKSNAPVKTVVMVVFRDEKNQENELKAWGFWHARQHSIKQRILDADAKTASGILGHCDDIAHNAVAFHWSPKEGPAKISIAVQCLSTDFSNQKGVKGVPMHLQIDTYATDSNSRVPLHRAYTQIKVFCDKGAERKTRDEERRILKRKQAHAGRRKIEELYHTKSDKTEFYQMADVVTSPVLFNPSHHNAYMVTRVDVLSNSQENNFYSHQEPDTLGLDKDCPHLDANGNIVDPTMPPAAKRPCFIPSRSPVLEDKVVIQIKDQPTNTHLSVSPPTLEGLANALEAMYNIQANLVQNIYKRSKRGATVQMDNDLIKYYANKGEFKLDVTTTEDAKYRVTLIAV